MAGQAVLDRSVAFLFVLVLLASTPARADDSQPAAEAESKAASTDSKQSTADKSSVKKSNADAKELDPAHHIRPALYVSDGETRFRRIGPTALVTEVSTGLPFPARVDTGATSCAIHCAKFVIEDAAEEPAENVGKPIRILVVNHEGEQQWIKTKIVDHVTVRTTTDDDERYKVPIKLRWQDIEKKVLVTLSDRAHMTYPLLLGRNFLSGDFIVDVALDADH
jgi:hypothetical protein